jgi:hypothetical protein
LKILFFILLLLSTLNAFSQAEDTPINSYDTAFEKIRLLIEDNSIGNFKRAVFICENTYDNNRLSEEKFNSFINHSKLIIQLWSRVNPINNYHQTDSINFQNNFAIYHFLKDTTKLIVRNEEYFHLPLTYDFDDFFGYNDWSNMFVTKLLASHKGNCHSLPYLYKILADELGATCWLSLAPNHMYIKNRCQKIGWYNTELTSGEFPIDAWIATSGYVPVDAIRNGIYMDTLSNQQAIALCVLDLAKGYESQTKNYYDGFILKCCDLVLQYHPLNVQAILLKAETLKRLYMQYQKEDSRSKNYYQQMEILYTQLFNLGYREMPEKMYMQWLRSVTEQQNKYGNKQLKETLKDKL